MRPSDQLAEFTREALKAGRSRDEISQALTQAGWAGNEVDEALAAWVDSPFSPPIPRPRPQLSAREAFFYLLLFGALGWTAWHVGSLLFQAIDVLVPKAGDKFQGWERDMMRFSIASLIVTTPLFLWLHTRVSRDVARAPGKRRSPVRKWLGYIAMFLAATTILGDLVHLISRLLDGDLTLQITLKSGVLAAVAGAVFVYFRDQVGRDDDAA